MDGSNFEQCYKAPKILSKCPPNPPLSVQVSVLDRWGSLMAPYEGLSSLALGWTLVGEELWEEVTVEVD